MRKIIFAFLFLNAIIIAGVNAQASLDIQIPQQFLDQFKLDQARYLNATNPAAGLAGRAFNFWNAAKKNQLKGYDLDSLFSIYQNLRKKDLLRKCEFIKQNSTSYASLYYFNEQLLNRTSFTPDSLLSIYTNLSKELQQTPLGQYVRQSINRKSLLLLGKEMPTFSFKTTTGENVKLSSFRDHHYVLLCFWASWCGPCTRNIPFLKKIEETYKNKGLQIISVSVDTNTDKWQAALKKYEMPWLQTCDLPPYTNGELSTLYEIHYIPEYLLIDKQGKLIYQNILTNDHDDYHGLKEILQKLLD